MSVIQNYSWIASSNLLQANSTNFPALKHFWSCPQSDIGQAFLTDSVGSCNLILASGTIGAGSDTNSVNPSAAAAGTTLSGTLTASGNNLLLFACATWGATAGFVIGDSASGAGISLAKSGLITDPSANLCNLTAFAIASAYSGRAILVRTFNAASGTTTGAASFEANDTTTVTALGNVATSIANASGTAVLSVTGWGSVNKWACASGATSALYGAALFKFSSLPSDTLINEAISWMAYQWKNGKKAIYPGLKGIA